jgi:poly-gamma-glutamate capsule biosynthesis protein CapA/YwtB (metallophosphatase superfamily)
MAARRSLTVNVKAFTAFTGGTFVRDPNTIGKTLSTPAAVAQLGPDNTATGKPAAVAPAAVVAKRIGAVATRTGRASEAMQANAASGIVSLAQFAETTASFVGT